MLEFISLNELLSTCASGVTVLHEAWPCFTCTSWHDVIVQLDINPLLVSDQIAQTFSQSSKQMYNYDQAVQEALAENAKSTQTAWTVRAVQHIS